MNLKDSARDALHTNFDRLARQREVDAEGTESTFEVGQDERNSRES